MPEFTGTQDLRGYLRVLWRWKLLFLVFLVAVPAAVYAIDRGKRSVYQSTALVGVNQTTVSGFTTNNLTAIAALVTTTPVASAAADLMHPPANAGEIASEVTATGDSTTGFLRISAQDQNPVRAAAIANAFAQAIGANLQQSAYTQAQASIKRIRSQLSHLKSKDPLRLALEQQLIQLRSANATVGSQAAVLQAATPDPTPVGPHLRRTVELAALIGLLLGLGAVVLAENADRRLRSPADLEHMADVPLLATIPPSAFSGKLDTGPADEESFQMLRTALMYFNPSRDHQSVVVTSPGEKDGKTTVAIRLALAAARAGLSVVLVDADLRRAQIALRLGLDAREGLGAVLAGQRRIDEVMIPYPVDEVGAGELRILPAGPPSANPAALISSPQMEGVLSTLEADANLVIIDTPAALMVSDAMPLMELATGIVLVARMNRSGRDKIKRLRKIVSAAKGNLFGVVATGTQAEHGYYASNYYSQNGHTGGRWRRRKAKAASKVAPPQAESRSHEEPNGSAVEDASASEIR